MRKIVLIAFAAVLMLIGGNLASAQSKYGTGADSAECIKYLSYYAEYYKQKNYDSAIPNWRMAYKICPPQARQSIFVDGAVLVRRLIAKNSRNKEYRQALIDTLMTLHDTRIQYYPKYAVAANNAKGADLTNYYKDNNEVLYNELGKIIAANGDNTTPSFYMVNFTSAVALYQEGKLEADVIMDLYEKNIAALDKVTPKDEKEAEKIADFKTTIENNFISSRVASCENLLELFTPRYEANPDDLALVSKIALMMSKAENCTDNELYLKAVTSMYNLDPSAKSAYYLFRLHASRNNVNEASKYMEEALAFPDLDNASAADYNYQYATFCVKNGLGAKGFSAAQKAMELDETYAGKCYFLMGTIWGTTSCGGDEISRRAPYWVACDYMAKAKAADPSLTEDCNRMISQYSVYFPQTAEAFMYDLTNGQSYTVSCGGMRATTTVRTQK
ncbi:MAG: hypothetical protein J6Z20_04005 [Bacteroidales bacterium]|nr:hypothetical protein [Bacteroidales bacterium]MBP5740850.1 hypothetical protein [Bacteroidales bacterium]MBQ2526659.1 hypothetical protein [Bacteroidales bacterium]SKC35119.1 hypothetical protein SAMN06298215_0167 [Bacteroidales bacterium WCE2008]